MSNKSEDSDLENINEEEAKEASESALPAIERFYAQIQTFPKLISKAHVIDRTLLHHFHDIRHSASDVIEQLKKEKQSILKKFDSWLMPLAQEVLEELLEDADELKEDLDHSLDKLDSSIKKDWIEYAKKWTQLYARWHDRKGITKKVLKLAAERNSNLIEKDIKVIKDYQDQTLSSVPKGSEEFFNLEKRLFKATSEPLRHLVELKKGFSDKDDLSIKQASEWIANLQKQRESYFDMVLVKIDSAVKEVVSQDVSYDSDLFNELEGEIKFTEQEIKQIDEMLKVPQIDKSELAFLKERVNCLIDHLEEYDLQNIPKELENRLNAIRKWIEVTLQKLPH
jgi:hypothetical protein